MNTPQLPSGLKAAWVAGVIIVIVAVSGYFTGLRQTRSRVSHGANSHVTAVKEEVQGTANAVPPMVQYREVDRKLSGPNAGFRSDVRLITPAGPAMYPTNVTDAERAQAVAQRASRRAYDGAPPTVPHPAVQDSFSCLACHGPGLQVKDRLASRISHPYYSNCNQCHVAQSGASPIPADAALREPIAENSFATELPVRRGLRAWEGAPPTIPHPTLMRSDCLSCHGSTGAYALRTPHSDRQSCTQCHVPDAGLNQHDFRATLANLEQFPGPSLTSQ